jgi:hypothetical protein
LVSITSQPYHFLKNVAGRPPISKGDLPAVIWEPWLYSDALFFLLQNPY